MKSPLACAQPRSGVAEVDIMSNFTFCNVASSFDFGFGAHRVLREGVVAFYKDPTNLTVPIEVALPQVRDALAVKHPRGAIGIGRDDAQLSQDSRATLDRMKLLLAVLFAFPLFHSSHVPAVFRTRIDTTAGSFVIETHRDWSPKGADRFYELVREHYYDNSRFFRVVPGRWVQFGIAGDPKVAQAWRHKTIPDDTLKVHNKPGYVAFSNTGPRTRSTQVYINLRDNSALNDSEPAFAPFGKVVEGWDVVEKLYGGYGENSGSGMRAGHQDKIFEGGNAYMDKEFPKLDRLIRAAIVTDK